MLTFLLNPRQTGGSNGVGGRGGWTVPCTPSQADRTLWPLSTLQDLISIIHIPGTLNATHTPSTPTSRCVFFYFEKLQSAQRLLAFERWAQKDLTLEEGPHSGVTAQQDYGYSPQINLLLCNPHLVKRGSGEGALRQSTVPTGLSNRTFLNPFISNIILPNWSSHKWGVDIEYT